MLQNTARASVYSNGVATIKSLPRFNLKDYTVDVYWLDNPRHKALQNTALAQEWANYIDAISSLGKIQKVR
jgi:hypothetical protein